MRTRAPVLAAVVAFALAVVAVAVLAGRGSDERLVKLPVAALGGAGGDEAAGGATARSSPMYGGPVEYRVEGALPDLPATAPAYRLGSATTASAVQRLAASLGLEGDVRTGKDAWVVGAGERVLRVQRQPGLPWFLGQGCPEAPAGPAGSPEDVSCFAVSSVAGMAGGVAAVGTGSSAGAQGASSPPEEECPPGGCVVGDPIEAFDPSCPAGAPNCGTVQGAGPACSTADAGSRCPVPTSAPPPAPAPPSDCGPGTACGTTPPPTCGPNERCVPQAVPPKPVPVPPGVDPAPPTAEARPADLPSEQDARRLADEVFARLGVGTERLVVEDAGLTWEARVDARVDRLPVIGLGTSLSIGAKGQIVRANGFLATPVRIGDYPLVGADGGLKRLRAGFGAGPVPLGATDNGAYLKGAVAPAMPECDDPAAGCVAPPRRAPVVQVVTGAHLALVQSGDALVPAYVFELAENGATIPVPAVTDEWLDQQASTVED